MRQGGRPRRSEEQPDSPFGEMLKGYMRRINNFTQVELSRESVVAEKTLSNMIKGTRSTSGSTFRRDLREIVKVLYRKNALQSLEGANHLLTAIPGIRELDSREPEDAKVIDLFTPPSLSSSIPPAFSQGSPALSSSNLQQTPLAVPSRTKSSSSSKKTRRIITVGISLLIIGGLAVSLLIITRALASPSQASCVSGTGGVILYTDLYYQGKCHVFGPGDYELAQFGLEENVSSLKDPDNAYHVTLFDKAKNFYNVDTNIPVFPAEWDNRADTIHVEKHRPTTCHPGLNGILAFINADYAGGCLFITKDIPDLTPLDFDQAIVSLQFVGSYQNTRQLVLYLRPNYQDECGAYWQDQSDLLQCARNALSVRVPPFTPPTPIPTVTGTHAAGNVAPLASLSPGNAQAAVDGNLQTEWIGGHQTELDLNWAFPVTIHRVVVWDRKQSPTDNNQINTLKLAFSDGTATGSLEMISQGPRCVDITFPAKMVNWLHIIPVDASGNNGLREVEVWATTGPQYSQNTCVNKVTVSQTIPQTMISPERSTSSLFSISLYVKLETSPLDTGPEPEIH